MENQILRPFLALKTLRALAFAAWVLFSCHSSAMGKDLELTSAHFPEPVTAEADPVLSFSVSRDGKYLAFVSKRNRFPDLWLRTLDVLSADAMRQLTSDPALESDPAFSQDGRFLAYVSTARDAKGDVYVIDLKRDNPEPVRLTENDTEDGAPCFGPKNTLYFHRKAPGQLSRELVRIRLDVTSRAFSMNVQAEVLPTLGDAAYPSLSPDGSQIAFVSHRNAAFSDVYVLNLESEELRQLTSGPFADLFPCWSPDGRYLFFSREPWDTNDDGRTDARDNAVLYRVGVHGGDPYPLTSARFSSTRPLPAENSLYFLSDTQGTSNCWRIPADGQIPHFPDPKTQMKFARNLMQALPDDPYLALLAHFKVIERYPHLKDLAADALGAMGRIFQEIRMPEQADRAFEKILLRYPDQNPQAPFARIHRVLLKTEEALRQSADVRLHRQIIDETERELEKIGEGQDADIRLFTEIERARVLSTDESSGADKLRAVRILDALIARPDASPERRAEARVLKGDIFRKIGNLEAVYPVYLTVVQQAADTPQWADAALERLLDLILSQKGSLETQDRIQLLKRLADQHQTDTPKLAMGALNRAGDLLYAAGEGSHAKSVYRQVIDQFPVQTTQTAAARFALAEILYREQRFREALSLYEHEIRLREKEDRIRELARRGFIRKSIEGAEYLFELGEIDSARSLFKEILDFDRNVIEAHRGYIKCAAAQNALKPVQAAYHRLQKLHPLDPVAVYAAGLSSTYRTDRKSLQEAKALLKRAVLLNGQIGHFHRTLGYTLEVLETVHGEKGGLEGALESYQKAFYLTDAKGDPTSYAELCLNLGNVHFLLGQYAKAFHYYFLRLSSKKPIGHFKAAILFYQRLGICAFQIRNLEQTLSAYSEASRRIDSGIDAQDPLAFLNRNHRYVMDRIIAPALRVQALKKEATALSDAQSEANRALSEIEVKQPQPVGEAWNVHRRQILTQVHRQEKLNERALSLVKASMKTGLHPGEDPEAFHRALSLMLSKAKDAVSIPEQLIGLKAEMLDRLGLAFQESGEFKKAVEAFQQAFSLNEKLGQRKNLPRNLRSVAFNRYLLADEQSGSARIQTLQTAAAEFARVIELVDIHGVSGPAQASRDALIRIDVQTALDAPGATRGGKGFSGLQEKRLAETFIARISVELGELASAEEALNRQTAFYPEGKSVSDSDAYGVSLLYHRAGHLSAAEGNWKTAFDHFRRSGELTFRNRNLTGTLSNAANLAKAFSRLSPEDPDGRTRIIVLRSLDRKAMDLIFRETANSKLVAGYHNVMGVYLASIPEYRKDGLLDTVEAFRRLQDAAFHFSAGIRVLEDPGAASPEREAFSLQAALHLNLGRTALRLGETSAARQAFERAVFLSEKGILPDIQWRALISLGRPDEALEILDSLTLLRAGCSKGEILDGFFLPVSSLLEKGQTEKAFNLLEKASEMERFNRLAPMVLRFSDPERRLLAEILSLLDRIGEIEMSIDRADPLLKNDLRADLESEKKRLNARLGKDGLNLPDPIRLIPDPPTRMLALRLAGLAALAESVADDAVRNPDKTDLRRRYMETVKRYRVLRKQVRTRGNTQAPSDALSLFGPETYEAVDVMENLPENGRYVRLFKTTAPTGSFSGPVLAFVLSPDRISAVSLPSVDAAFKTLLEPASPAAYLAFDHPEEIAPMLSGLKGVVGFVLNAGHFLRAVGHLKPFKRTVLRIPSLHPGEIGSHAAAEEAAKSDLEKDASGFHVLVLRGDVFLTHRVPTRPGEHSAAYAALGLENRQRFPLLSLLNRLGHTSCAVLEKASFEDAFWIGHLFTLYGCPTILLPTRPENAGRFAEAFLDAYRTRSARESLDRIRGELSEGNNWALLGHAGLSPEEAKAFARKSFESDVFRARQGFDGKRFSDALVLFENAIETASESDEHRMHLPALYAFARESAYLSGAREKSLDFARRLVRILEVESPGTAALAESQLRLGLLEAHQESYEAAAENMGLALKIYQGLQLTVEQSETLSELGRLAEQATDYERALHYFESSVSVSGKTEKRWVLGDRFRSIGRIFDLRLSRYAEAIKNYQRAASLYREGEQTPDSASRIAQAQLDIGRCHRLMGNLSEAALHYEAALQRVSGLPGAHLLRGKILIEQANNAWYQARYQEAFHLQRQAWSLAEQHELTHLQVVSLNTSGLLWWALGDNVKALGELAQALELAKRIPFREDEVATTLNNTGMVFRETGRYAEALASFEQALEIDKRLKSRWALAYDYRHIGVTHLKRGFPDKAIPLLSTALKEARALGNRIHEAKALLDLADAHAAASDASQADPFYQEALSLSGSLSLEEIRWRALFGLARLYRTTQPGRAIRLLQEAMEVIESIRSNIRINRLKDGFLSNKLMVYETLCLLLADSGKPVEALEIAERSRSRNFIDLLGSQSISLDPTVDRGLYDRYHRVKERIESLRQRASSESSNGAKEGRSTELEKAISELDTVVMEIQSTSPRLASLVTVEPIRAVELQKRIEPGVAFLSYFLLKEEIFCWRILPDDIRLFRKRIDRSRLEETILDYRRRIQNLEPFEKPSGQLFEILVRPILDGLSGIKRLGVIPHGVLHYLSFSTLTDGTDYLLDRFPVFYLPSASVYPYTQNKRTPEKNLKVLAIGNPDLGNPALDLPFSEYEVDSIRWNFPRITIMTRERATEKWVVDNIARFGIIHLASHGEFDPLNPLLSSVKLSRGEDRDGNLEAAEIFALDLSADLVVLSACQTGLGKVSAGDEVIGLTRAFLYAGTHALISSLWRVSDISTAMLIKEFYRRYVNDDKAESLRRAAQHVKNRYPHPGYWGAFTLVGDYQ